MTRYIKNTAILFAAMAITKIVGALFKIPLANLLGGTGMGYFSTAYGLYSPIFALTAAGVPTVIMRTTARSAATGNRQYAAAVRRYALIIFSVIGLLGTVAVAVFAVPFAKHIACSPQSTLAVICISPAVMLCCTASVLRGYREGLSDVMPSAAASIAEAVSRAVFGLGVSYAVIFYAKSAFYNGRSVFGTDAATVEQAYNAALPYAAAGAILAVSISEFFGLITLVLNERRTRNREPLPPRCTYRCRNICVQLLKETAPIAASALVMNCVSFVDLLTVTRTLSISAALDTEYFNTVFGGIYADCGGLAGLPNFMNMPGEELKGVYSANEFLTRFNLMKAYREDSPTPIQHPTKTIVVGGGNVAMDAARCAKRLGSEVHIVYRRSLEELPARKEEVEHAMEEGIIFDLLNNPVAVHSDENGSVKAVECIQMELGEPDDSGRRRPIAKEGSNFLMDADCMIMAIGTSPNPLIRHTTEGLETNRKGCLIVDDNEMTTRDGVFAGGDAVTGAATVISAMGAGKKAAAAMDQYIQKKVRNA